MRRKLLYPAIAVLGCAGALYLAQPHLRLVPRLFPNPESSSAGETGAEAAAQPAAEDSSDSVISFQSDSSLDPAAGRYFVLSVVFRFNRALPAGKGEKLVFKYNGNESPYPGWAVAVRHFGTSMRPEVYWQTDKGEGRWFTFAEANIAPNAEYRVTLFASEKFISLYGEANPGVAPSAVDFLGGYDTAGVGLPSSGGSLFVRRGASSDSRTRVDVREVLVAHTGDLPASMPALKKVFSGRIADLAAVLKPEEISLWLQEDGKDHSSRGRQPPAQGLS